MPDILTVTLNPAIDIAANVTRLEARGKLRCHAPHIDPGGGGVNVSRAIKELGGDSLAFVAVGGPIGDWYVELLNSEGVNAVQFEIGGHTRQSFAVTEEETGEQYRFVLPGPTWSKDESERALAEIIALSENKSYIVLSGSLPPGAPDDFYSRIAASIPNKITRVVLDTSAAALTTSVKKSTKSFYCIRMNTREAQQFGKSLFAETDATSLAKALVDRQVAEVVIVTHGEKGAVLATQNLSLSITPPQVKVVSAVGAGDSFVGAFTLGMSKNWSLRAACRYGVAAAASAMTTPATVLCQKDKVLRYLSKIQ
ncbi:MAG: 1-phosphofructokinase family hexose kinase [Pseudomonadota bacterium]